MSTEWLVVKYVADLRRQECVNVGVLVESDGQRTVRFKGQDPDGRIDGNAVKGWINSESWRGWVTYWMDGFIDDGDPLEAMISDSAVEHFRVVPGGRVVAGDDFENIDELANDLYRILVEDKPSTEIAPGTTHDSELRRLLTQAELIGNKHFKTNYAVNLGEDRGDFNFPYAWQNGVVNVGYTLWSKQSHLVDAAAYRLTGVPNHVGRVLITSASLDDAEPGPTRALEKVADVALIGQVTAEELGQMFRRPAAPTLV